MSHDDMQQNKPKRFWKIVLIVSIAINIATAGLIAGALWRFNNDNNTGIRPPSLSGSVYYPIPPSGPRPGYVGQSHHHAHRHTHHPCDRPSRHALNSSYQCTRNPFRFSKLKTNTIKLQKASADSGSL